MVAHSRRGTVSGRLNVAGDLTLASGAPQIELSSPSLADTLVVDGLMTLGGVLNVVDARRLLAHERRELADRGGWRNHGSVQLGYRRLFGAAAGDQLVAVFRHADDDG